MESLQAEAEGYAERQREFASVRFYLRDLLFEVSNRWRDATSSVTNYGPLIGEILRHTKKNEPICLVTFNYDLLLDRALESFDYHAQEPENQFKAPQILYLFKPHGSVDWARRLVVHADNWVRPEHLIDNVGTITLTSQYVRVANPENRQEWPNGKPPFPAIAIPFQNKTDSHFECPPHHLTVLCELLPYVRKILIIGWQASEAHFLSLLRSNLRGVTHLMVVGRDSADSDRVLQHFVGEIARTMHPNFQCYKGQGGFTNFIINREGEAFLESKGIGAQ